MIAQIAVGIYIIQVFPTEGTPIRRGSSSLIFITVCFITISQVIQTNVRTFFQVRIQRCRCDCVKLKSNTITTIPIYD